MPILVILVDEVAKGGEVEAVEVAEAIEVGEVGAGGGVGEGAVGDGGGGGAVTLAGRRHVEGRVWCQTAEGIKGLLTHPLKEIPRSCIH
jgi:hypothetical protein